MKQGYSLQIGQLAQSEFIVETQHTANVVGSGDGLVLATPVLVTKMEALCHQMVKENASLGQSSIGTSITLSHDQMTAVGSLVKLQAKIIDIQGNSVQFQLNASDETGAIATGVFTRALAKQSVLDRVLRLKKSTKNAI